MLFQTPCPLLSLQTPSLLMASVWNLSGSRNAVPNTTSTPVTPNTISAPGVSLEAVWKQEFCVKYNVYSCSESGRCLEGGMLLQTQSLLLEWVWKTFESTNAASKFKHHRALLASVWKLSGRRNATPGTSTPAIERCSLLPTRRTA